MKSVKGIISIILLIILFLKIDNTLSFYGRGFNFFNKKITYGYNTDYDSLEGFKIEEEGFIQIIGSGTEVSNNVEVSKIFEYSYDSSGIFCKVIDKRNKVFFVKVQYDQKGKPGTKIYYTLVQKAEISNLLKWYKVDNSSFIQILEILKLCIMSSILIITLLLIMCFFEKK